ncbi:MAG: GDSL family lipase [Clostridia bacterium]|nr:GDSL family lipase [Clostridia bacterium]
MNITKIFTEKKNDLWNAKCPTIAFLGDSVTQGCFDCYIKENGEIETYFEQDYTYHGYIKKIFAHLYPNVPVNIINAGISGDNAVHASQRLAQDVLKFSPDLTVVCFGLNDSGGGLEGIPAYSEALKKIFTELKNVGSEVIFMTPNMMNTRISCHLKEEKLIEAAKGCMNAQVNGILEAYLEKAKETAKECDVRICDVYAKWKLMYQNGVDTTEILANKINHPTHMMNWVFAYSLVEEMMK